MVHDQCKATVVNVGVEFLHSENKCQCLSLNLRIAALTTRQRLRSKHYQSLSTVRYDV